MVPGLPPPGPCSGPPLGSSIIVSEIIKIDFSYVIILLLKNEKGISEGKWGQPLTELTNL